MSVTTSSNVVSQTVLHLLTDYDLHHSGSAEQPESVAPPNPRTDLTAETSNPPGWPTAHRRIPSYRPIDQNLDRDERPGGANAVESIFIITMLSGCLINAVSTLVDEEPKLRYTDLC